MLPSWSESDSLGAPTAGSWYLTVTTASVTTFSVLFDVASAGRRAAAWDAGERHIGAAGWQHEPVNDFVDPEPVIKARIEETLTPLREELATAEGWWKRWVLRRRVRSEERRLRRHLGRAMW